MKDWITKTLGVERDYIAPDGSDTRLLASLPERAGLRLCELGVGRDSGRVRHKNVDEIWYVVSGLGEIARTCDDKEDVTSLVPGTSLTIPQGTTFQFRCLGSSPLQILIVSMPPWPGPDDAEIICPPPSSRRRLLNGPATAERRLVQLNEDFGEAERNRNWNWLDRVLADELEFRRANESSVDKETFLSDLHDCEYRTLDSLDIRPNVFDDVAAVFLVVRAAGIKKGQPFSGLFRNIRLFRLMTVDDESCPEWRLVRWYNTRIETAAHPPSANETYERILGVPNTVDSTGLRAHTLNHLYQVIWNRGVISDRDRRLITLSVLAAQGASDQLKDHLHGARMGGLSREELLEVMVQVAHYGGWARGTAGQKAVVEAFNSMKSI
jgi:alkylhydroperoxidase/carboxymuconolactone decarboxylase family protein YurZ/mannose-6-phosphate isomerase-like protein (cupin superfamily)